MLAAELGFTGRAALVEVTDDYQAERLRQANTVDQRFVGAYGYLRKVLKNAELAAIARDDVDALAELDAVRQELAEQLLVTAEDMKGQLRHQGYADQLTG